MWIRIRIFPNNIYTSPKLILFTHAYTRVCFFCWGFVCFFLMSEFWSHVANWRRPTSRQTLQSNVPSKQAFNRQLLSHVHPPDWINPVPADRYHMVVVGAGTAGLVTAIVAAGLGAKVALIERKLMGGDCLNVGCVPSKGVISAARAWKATRASSGADFGAPATSEPGNFSLAMERMRRLRADISHVDSAQRFTDLGVDVFIGEGRFTGRNSVQVGDDTLSFKKATKNPEGFVFAKKKWGA